MHKDLTARKLSIIIPVLNEASLLLKLFSCLSRQQRVSFEVIIADGGSSDDTVETARKLAKQYSLPVKVVVSEKGRGRQMNRGAGVAAGETLLFLHADSSFPDNLTLHKGLKELSDKILSTGTENVAGRFSLVFRHEKGCRLTRKLSLAYCYYENKARLNRTECINGDQGVLLTRSFFKRAGPFHEALPFLEDRYFAGMVANKGSWLLISPSIFTSSRRFFQEGLKERQTLNAIIMNFFSAGRPEFITGLPEVYKTQDKTKKMDLYPFLREIRGILSGLPLAEQFYLWYTTGSYILRNAWQIAFYIDIKREFYGDGTEGKREALCFYENVLKKLPATTLPRIITTVLVWTWFHFRFLRRK